MRKGKIFVVIICFGLFFCLINEATAVLINITDVNIIPDEPNEEDIITIVVSGSASQSSSIFEYSNFSKVGTSLHLDLFIDLGIADTPSTWSHAEEIGTLPPGTYTLTTRTFYFPTGDLKDTHITEFTVVPAPPIEAVLEIEPHTLNLQSKGKWLTCYIWLPDDYNVSDIEPNSILLQLENEPNAIEADWLWFEEGDEVAMAKFSRSEVQEMLSVGEVELTVTGQLIDGTIFEGTDTIRVIDKRRGSRQRPIRVNSNSIVVDGIEYYIQTDKSVYKLEEDVKMLYKVTNLRDEDVTFTFGGSPEWNFWVEKDGEVIWRAVEGWWAEGTAFTLAPNEYKEFRYVWDMKDHKGNLVIDIGKYNVLGRLDGGSSANPDDYYSFSSVAVGIETVP